jgi:hypothetical protein
MSKRTFADACLRGLSGGILGMKKAKRRPKEGHKKAKRRPKNAEKRRARTGRRSAVAVGFLADGIAIASSGPSRLRQVAPRPVDWTAADWPADRSTVDRRSAVGAAAD